MDNGPMIPNHTNDNYYKDKMYKETAEIINLQAKIGSIKFFRSSLKKTMAILTGALILTATPLGKNMADIIIKLDNKQFEEDVSHEVDEVIKHTDKTPSEIMQRIDEDIVKEHSYR